VIAVVPVGLKLIVVDAVQAALSQTRALEIMGYDEERIKRNFGHMIEALGSGTPPHGGIAWGLDRLLMVLLNEPNIREVIAFPKTGEGKDLLMQAPAPANAKSLKELGLEIKK
jgi:aspartyl-tRNA synthetase